MVINDKQRNRLWIVDDFYQDPHAVRQFALNQEYFEGGLGRGFIGRRTCNQYLFDGLKESFERIMNTKIVAWNEHLMNGRFQIAWGGEPLVYHCDNQRWGGMLYLTPDAPSTAGTSILDANKNQFVNVENKYNRLIAYEASVIHGISELFGNSDDTGRLTFTFFIHDIESTATHN